MRITLISRTRRRVGFTLIELIVVIAIIAALMALSAAAVIKFMGTQEGANTQSTLDRTQAMVNKAWSKVKDQAYKETIPANVDLWIRQNLAGNDANAAGRVRVIYVKLKLRQAFPMTFSEATQLPAPTYPPQLGPLPAYQTYLNSFGITGSTNPPANYESSVCLLMALQRGVSGAGIDSSDLTKGGATGTMTMASGKSLPYLTDAWGTPIYFARFPVGSTALNPNGAQMGANDPGDPLGYLQTPNWAQTMGPLGTFGSVFTALTLQQLAPGNTSFKLAPLLASAGPDQKPGFDPMTFKPTPGADDLFSNP